MYQTRLESTATIPEIIDSIIKSIAGQQLRKLTISITAENDFANIKNLTKITFQNVILLKNSKNLIFCTYNLQNRQTIFNTPLLDIESIYYFSGNSPKQYVIVLSDSSGLGWLFNIET